jgi:hypothetical protein
MSPLASHVLVSYGEPCLLVLTLGAVALCVGIHHRKKRVPFPRRPFFHVLRHILVLCYSTLIKAGLEVLDCRTIGGRNVLVSNNSVYCEGSSYAVAAAVGVSISCVVSVVIPVVIVWAHVRKSVQQCSTPQMSSSDLTLKSNKIFPLDPDLSSCQLVECVSPSKPPAPTMFTLDSEIDPSQSSCEDFDSVEPQQLCDIGQFSKTLGVSANVSIYGPPTPTETIAHPASSKTSVLVCLTSPGPR